MKTRVTLRPGERGTKQLQSEYGDRLVCVRYRYDPKARMRYKTVELIVDEKPYLPENSADYFAEVTVRIAFHERALRDRVKASGGRWDPESKVWRMMYKDVLELDLEHRVQRVAKER